MLSPRFWVDWLFCVYSPLVTRPHSFIHPPPGAWLLAGACAAAPPGPANWERLDRWRGQCQGLPASSLAASISRHGFISTPRMLDKPAGLSPWPMGPFTGEEGMSVALEGLRGHCGSWTKMQPLRQGQGLLNDPQGLVTFLTTFCASFHVFFTNLRWGRCCHHPWASKQFPPSHPFGK